MTIQDRFLSQLLDKALAQCNIFIYFKFQAKK